jgi:hypothetical protein
MLDDAELTERWLGTLRRLADRPDLPGLLGGRLTRLLHDTGQLDNAEVGLRMGRILTVGTPTVQAAGWIEGFLAGGGLLLLHDERLLTLVDTWLTDLPADPFIEVLPLLRRTFCGFTVPERRAIGERVRAGTADRPADGDTALDQDRAARVLPTVALLLGRELEVAL